MSKKHTAFVLEPSFGLDEEQKNVLIHLWSKLDDGRTVLVKKTFKPYFYIAKDDEAKAKELAAKEVVFEDTSFVSMQGVPVIKVITSLVAQLVAAKEVFEKNDITCYEADVRTAYKAMMDWGVHTSFVLSDAVITKENGLLVMLEPTITACDEEFIPSLSILSFDIESNKDTGDIFCLSCYGKNEKGEERTVMFIVSDEAVPNAHNFPDEKGLLEAFVAYIRKEDPDVITGWNVIDFDINLLQERMKKCKVPFSIGRDGSLIKTRIESSFFKDSKADCKGRLILDGIQLLKNNFIKLSDYKLDTAAKKFANEEKLIQTTGQEKYEEITSLYDNDKASLLQYNLLDAKLAYDVIINSGAFPLTVKRSLLVGMPMDRVNASIATLDSLYLKELHARGIVAPPQSGYSRDDEGLGGFVMQSKPGIYDYVIVCDFKSLYPSLMRTFNIDPLMFVDEAKVQGDAYIVAPNGAHFKRDLGIIPGLITTFWNAREKARLAGDELARYAIKIHMNSIYGVLASPNSRFFNRQIGNAITSFAQFFIKLIARKVKELGYEVIGGDTDSVFINLSCDSYDEAQVLGKEIEKSSNEFLKKVIADEYHVDSFMELEFEKTFIRFVMPKVRGSDVGAKKRYAGLILKNGKEEMSFTGLEMVRRDWTDLAKEFQYTLYKKIFAREEVTTYVKQFIDDLKKGKLDDKLVYKKALRKGVEEYTKTTPPHVKAAMKLDKIENDVIEYVMTLDGPEPVQKIVNKLDYDHYIDKQLRPIADAILSFYETSFDDLISGTSQASLFDF